MLSAGKYFPLFYALARYLCVINWSQSISALKVIGFGSKHARMWFIRAPDFSIDCIEIINYFKSLLYAAQECYVWNWNRGFIMSHYGYINIKPFERCDKGRSRLRLNWIFCMKHRVLVDSVKWYRNDSRADNDDDFTLRRRLWMKRFISKAMNFAKFKRHIKT